MDVTTLPLMRWLKKKETAERSYEGKVRELRSSAAGWLEYSVQTYPHYPRHTAGHSDEIVDKVSRLLFPAGERKPVVRGLNAVEAYIIIAAAYLHDAGMVASDEEKGTLLGSEEWREWLQKDPSAKQEAERIEKLRSGPTPASSAQRNYLADVQVRWLIAEHIRQRHHLRSGEVAGRREALLGRFAFGDSDLLLAITEVCVGHGLTHEALDEQDRFPEERLISHEPVNLHFATILLRLGDLLDLGANRACPLPRSAALPLPPASVPHWDQYGSIHHRKINTRSIEVSAKFTDPAAHGVLSRWCAWIEQELIYATRATRRWSTSHRLWEVPAGRFDIKLVAGASATPPASPAVLLPPSPSAVTSPLPHTPPLSYGHPHRGVCQQLVALAKAGATGAYALTAPPGYRKSVLVQDFVARVSGMRAVLAPPVGDPGAIATLKDFFPWLQRDLADNHGVRAAEANASSIAGALDSAGLHPVILIDEYDRFSGEAPDDLRAWLGGLKWLTAPPHTGLAFFIGTVPLQHWFAPGREGSPLHVNRAPGEINDQWNGWVTGLRAPHAGTSAEGAFDELVKLSRRHPGALVEGLKMLDNPPNARRAVNEALLSYGQILFRRLPPCCRDALSQLAATGSPSKERSLCYPNLTTAGVLLEDGKTPVIPDWTATWRISP